MKTRIIKVNIALLMAVAFSLTTIGPALADSLELGNTVTTGDTFVNGGDTTIGVTGASGVAGRINLTDSDPGVFANHFLTVDASGTLNFDGSPLNDNVILGGDVTGAAGANTLGEVVNDSKVIDNSLTAASLDANSVEASELADNAVDTAAIVNLNVTTAKIALDAIDNTLIDDDAVQTENILADAITNAKLADNAVQLENMADSSVGSTEIVDGTIVSGDIAVDTIAAVDVAPNAIGASELADDAVDTAAIVNLNVTTAKIALDAIDNTLVDDNAIQLENMANDSVSSAEIVDNSIGADDITETGVNANIKAFVRYIPTATEPTSASVANAGDLTYNVGDTPAQTETMVMLPFTSPVLYLDLVNSQVLGDGAPAALGDSGSPTSIAGGALSASFTSGTGIVAITNNSGQTLEMTIIPVAYD